MYKLSQWAGDFPNALGATRELHASVHEPTRGTSLFQICVTAFAYISILSCFPVSYINPPHPRASFIPPPPSLFCTRAVQISRNCRCHLVLQRTDGRMDGHADRSSAAAGESSSPYNHDWPCQATDWRAAPWEWRWWKESSWQYAQVPAALCTLRGTLFLLSPLWFPSALTDSHWSFFFLFVFFPPSSSFWDREFWSCTLANTV